MKAINAVDVPSHGEWPNLMQISTGAMLALDLIDQCQAPMLLAEQHLTSGITQARLRELQAGRATARNAMHHLKQNAGPILTGPTGAPVWPDGYCGSLSHTTHHVAAIIALATRYDSVGVDIDDKRPLGSAVRDVATIAELEIVDAMVQDGATSAECLIFSVKEAIFKCQYPLTKDESLDFLDIRLVRGDRPNTLKFRVTDQERTLLTQLAPHIQLHSYNIQGVTTVCAVLPKQ